MQTFELLYLLDIVGIVSCSIAGAILACRKGLDLFGVLLISTVASIGGGTIRDLLLNNHPIFWLDQYSYLIIIFISSFLTMVFYKKVLLIEKPLRIFDAIGLSAFTIIGIEIALLNNLNPFLAMIMGIITASFGGILRDIICNEIPLVLREEIYITASLIGGAVFFLLSYFGLAKEIIYLVTILVIFIIRVVAIYKNLTLPKLIL